MTAYCRDCGWEGPKENAVGPRTVLMGGRRWYCPNDDCEYGGCLRFR